MNNYLRQSEEVMPFLVLKVNAKPSEVLYVIEPDKNLIVISRFLS